MVSSPHAAAYSKTGRQTFQHDRHLIHDTPTANLYCIADGHGPPKYGHTVSHHVVNELPKLLRAHNALAAHADLTDRIRNAVRDLDRSAIKITTSSRVYAGSTLCAILRIGKTLHAINVGDSRAIIIPTTGEPRQLTTDHLCINPSEKARIEKNGGVVVGGLLNGYCSVSRAIGDQDLKGHRNSTPFPFNSGRKFGEDLFVSDPDITKHTIQPSDMVSVVASDGVYGVLSNADIAAVVRAEMRKERDANEIAKAVVKKAASKGSKGNVSIIVTFLHHHTTTSIMPHTPPAASYSKAGRQHYQHDRYLIHETPSSSLYAIADGHGSAKHGHTVSHHIVGQLPALLRSHDALASSPDLSTRMRNAIAELDRSAILVTSNARVYAGSTLCSVLRVGKTLVTANVGDSRALVIQANGDVRQITKDHVCTHPAEKARIEKAGGIVVGGLLNGYISMSRAIGDDDLKSHRNITPFPFNSGKKFGKDLFTGEPDIANYQIQATDVAVVVASDGVWGSLSNIDVATVIRNEIRKERDVHAIAKAVVKKAMSKGSKDNATAVVAFLRDEATVRILVGSKYRRRRTHGSSTPRNIVDIASDFSADDSRVSGSSSSDGTPTPSTDALLEKPARLQDRVVTSRRSQDMRRPTRVERPKWGQRHFSSLR